MLDRKWTSRRRLVWCLAACALVATVADACPTGVTGPLCNQCDEWDEYYGVYPDCRKCVAGVGDYCSLAGTLIATAGTTCDCLCRNKFNGLRCDQCPPHRDTTSCSACVSGYEDATTNGECGQKCTVANCTFKGTASGNYIDGCTCSCTNKYNPATFCSQCLAGYDIAFDCAACLPGFEGYNSGYCARICTPALDCNGTNTASASGNLNIGCSCHCKNAWFGGKCSQCAPLHNASSACAVCVNGYTEFPNCTRICREDLDCNSHALSASGNLRIGCTCACRNFWSGLTCATCPTGFNVTDDCGSCSFGYTFVSGACIRDCDSSDCNFHSNSVTGLTPNCTCFCRNGWSGNRCQTCTLPFTGLDCDQCAPTYTGFPNCIKNCTVLGDCAGNAATVQGFANGTCACSCRNGWEGPTCATCPFRFNRTMDCFSCNITTHEGEGLNCFRRCSVTANCSNHAYGVTGNDNTTCDCNCTNQWGGPTCSVCPPRFNASLNCGACAAGYEGYPHCYLSCTSAANCSGHAAMVSGNTNVGCNCTCRKHWMGGDCSACPAKYDPAIDCGACAAGYFPYPACPLLCTNASNCTGRAVAVSGDSIAGCSCVCGDHWTGPDCNTCPPGGNISDQCRSCLPGYGGRLCERYCTIATDCSSHATNVTGFAGNCTCSCTTNWAHGDCSFCPQNFVATSNCDGCAPGFVEYPACHWQCTIPQNCSGRATAVNGTSNTGCTCACTAAYTGGDCSICPSNYDNTTGCSTCATNFNFYPQCIRDCTDAFDCSLHSTAVSGVFPNCSCTCRNSWAFGDCSFCPQQYNQAADCLGCAAGHTGMYPACHFVCTNAANCTGHATAVSGDTSTNCSCTCENHWAGARCESCPARFNASANCMGCSNNHINYPVCTHVCNSADDCFGHASAVTGFDTNCTCSCRHYWQAPFCERCPVGFNASDDCKTCAAGYEQLPNCYLTCTSAGNCSNHAAAVVGNSNTGCNCTCRNAWFGPQCSQCPPNADPASDCTACLPGYGGFPSCTPLCTDAVDCSGRSSAVSGLRPNCTCTCRNAYSGKNCSTCASNYNASLDCGACAAGYEQYPLCARTCTIAADCSGRAVNVSGNSFTGCSCTCRNHWSLGNCSVCPRRFDASLDCTSCSPGFVNYPACDRICTNYEDCTDHATAVAGIFPNCSCSCDAGWASLDCSVCPPRYDPLDNCRGCAAGYVGGYPTCAFQCTIPANCSNRASAVSGTELTGCSCTCRHQWNSSDCSQCAPRYDPAKDCGACAYGYEAYPACRVACLVERDCSSHASNTSGIWPACACACRNKWYGMQCQHCDPQYNQTGDCGNCARGFEDYPNCYRQCNQTDCNSRAVEVTGNANTGCVCSCRHAWFGPQCETCPLNVNATNDCRTCDAGYADYPRCAPQCTPHDCTNRSVSVSGGRPNCTCVCRNGWSGSDCSVCPIAYIEATDCDACSPGHERVNGKCYRYCNVSLDCNGRGTNVTGNVGTGCNCTCRNAYIGSNCSTCPAGAVAATDCDRCITGFSGYPICRRTCTNGTDCSLRATNVSGVEGACRCQCRNGYAGYSCDICPARYNVWDDCGSCHKWRRQDYPNCSRLTRSIPTQSATLSLTRTRTVVIVTQTATITPLWTPSSTFLPSVTGTDPATPTPPAAPSVSGPHTRSSPLTTSLHVTNSRSVELPHTLSPRPTRTRALPVCSDAVHCIPGHGNASYREEYRCACSCFAHWYGPMCESCPSNFGTTMIGAYPQGCVDCAAGFVRRNGTCMTSWHIYGELQAGNASCAADVVAERMPSGTAPFGRLALLASLSRDLGAVMRPLFEANCSNGTDGTITIVVYDMTTPDPAPPRRNVTFLYDAVVFATSARAAEWSAGCVRALLDIEVYKNLNNGSEPTAPPTPPPTSKPTAGPTAPPPPTFAPARRAFEAMGVDEQQARPLDTPNATGYLEPRMGVNGTGCLVIGALSARTAASTPCGLFGCAPLDFLAAPEPEPTPFPWWWILLGVSLLALLIALIVFIARRLRTGVRQVKEEKAPDTFKYTLEFLIDGDTELQVMANERDDEMQFFFDDDDDL